MYTILTLWSQLQNIICDECGKSLNIPYWLCGVNFKMDFWSWSRSYVYTILTLWSQLQNSVWSWTSSAVLIPYWLCGVNFKIAQEWGLFLAQVYHIDSVESTSKFVLRSSSWRSSYTILTLWSQLQNRACKRFHTLPGIPYWLCGVNFKMKMGYIKKRVRLYHIDSVESTSK